MIKLPEPVGYFSFDWSLTPYGMKLMQSSNPEIAQTFEPAYSKQAILDALEEAAKVCDKRSDVLEAHLPPGLAADYFTRGAESASRRNAAAIRKLKEDIQ